jgi:hypothetical protein
MTLQQLLYVALTMLQLQPLPIPIYLSLLQSGFGSTAINIAQSIPRDHNTSFYSNITPSLTVPAPALLFESCLKLIALPPY